MDPVFIGSIVVAIGLLAWIGGYFWSLTRQARKRGEAEARVEKAEEEVDEEKRKVVELGKPRVYGRKLRRRLRALGKRL